MLILLSNVHLDYCKLFHSYFISSVVLQRIIGLFHPTCISYIYLYHSSQIPKFIGLSLFFISCTALGGFAGLAVTNGWEKNLINDSIPSLLTWHYVKSNLILCPHKFFPTTDAKQSTCVYFSIHDVAYL